MGLPKPDIACRLRHPNVNRQYPHLEAVLATFLYTGGRSAEVLRLKVDDVDFEAKRVHIRPNECRALKRPYHKRAVPLYEALELALRRYLADTGITQGLLFPMTIAQRELAVPRVSY
jgi:integrase